MELSERRLEEGPGWGREEEEEEDAGWSWLGLRLVWRTVGEDSEGFAVGETRVKWTEVNVYLSWLWVCFKIYSIFGCECMLLDFSDLITNTIPLFEAYLFFYRALNQWQVASLVTSQIWRPNSRNQCVNTITLWWRINANNKYKGGLTCPKPCLFSLLLGNRMDFSHI